MSYETYDMTAIDHQIKDQLKYINTMNEGTQMNTIPMEMFYGDSTNNFLAVSQEGHRSTFESKEQAESWAQGMVQKNDGLEFVICKALSRVHQDKPVVIKEIN